MTDNEQKKNEETVATNELLSNMEDITVAQRTDSSAAKAKKKVVKEEAEDENKVFRKFKIKDIVFLAMMAACMVWNKDNYYLLCFSNGHDNVVTYRLDKMDDVKVDETEREPRRENRDYRSVLGVRAVRRFRRKVRP